MPAQVNTPRRGARCKAVMTLLCVLFAGMLQLGIGIGALLRKYAIGSRFALGSPAWG